MGIKAGNFSAVLEVLAEVYCFIDHKTDKQSEFAKHQQQLMAYAKALKLEKPVLGVVLNWIRSNVIELKEMKDR